MLNEEFTPLTKEEQKELVLSLVDRHAPIYGQGGGRLVFEHPLDSRKVIKIALGEGGVRQNLNEQRVYSDYGDHGYLATIYGFSPYVEVMEKVVDCMFCDINEYFYEKRQEDESYDYEIEEQEAWDLVEWLNNITGNTADNEQIGYTSSGDLVSYDYGFNTSNKSREQTSKLSSRYFDVYNYLLGLVDVIDEEMTIKELEEQILYREEEDEDDVYCDYNFE